MNNSIRKPFGLEYRGYQIEGIKFNLERPQAVNTDEPGLGKTIQVAGTINSLPFMAKGCLIVCPASLKLNWYNELNKWLVCPYHIKVINGTKDTLSGEINIINYDILTYYSDEILNNTRSLVVFDEAHYLKNIEAQRTDIGLNIPSERRIFLTGTPIVNRPVDIWPMLNSIDAEYWGSLRTFGLEFCNGYRKTVERWIRRPVNGRMQPYLTKKEVWDWTGASNLHELQRRLKSTCMIRRLKKDVLTELPDKVRRVIEIPSSLVKQTKEVRSLAKEVKTLRAKLKYAESVEAMESIKNMALDRMSKLRKQQALSKVPAVVEYLRDAIAESGKVICFAHHQDVISAIADAFDNSLVIHGGVPMNKRQPIVDKFQNDPDVKLIVCNIQAAGTGFTMTASNRVVFAELDWVPGNVTQAEDRAHRITQKNTVVVDHLVLEGSIDANMAKAIVRKQNNINKALDFEEIDVFEELDRAA